MNEVSTIGLDLAKEVFQVHGADAAGAVVFRKRLRRTAVLQFFAAQASLTATVATMVGLVSILRLQSG